MNAESVEKEEPLTLREKILGALGVFAIPLGLFLVSFLFGGCVSECTGSSTVIGSQMALPEVSDSSDSLKIRIFESIKGARVWTAKDSKVTVEYRNTYTNSYFGIMETRDSTDLKVKVEPLYVGHGEEASDDEN